MNKKTVLVLTAFAMVIIIGAIRFSGFLLVKEDNIIQVGYKASVNYIPLFVGLEKGYFTENGLEIKSVKFESTNQMFESLAMGRIDAVPNGNFEVLAAIEAVTPGKIKLISAGAYTKDNFMESIVVKSNSSIASISDIRGKKIGVAPGSMSKIIVQERVKKYFDPNEVEIVPLKFELQLQALEIGGIDALFSYEPITSIGLSKGIIKKIDEATFSKALWDPIFLEGAAVSADFIKNRPKIAKKYIKAIERTIDFMNSNQQEAKKLAAKHIGLEENIAANVNTAKNYKLSEVGPQEIEGIQKTLDFFMQKGIIKNRLDASLLVYS